jgi:hypothetical protein
MELLTLLLNNIEGTVDSLSDTLASGIGNAFGDFFNSIIDGTKSAEDAFKDMVKAILKQLVQLFIIRPIMNSIQSALGGGGGCLVLVASSGVLVASGQVEALFLPVKLTWSVRRVGNCLYPVRVVRSLMPIKLQRWVLKVLPLVINMTYNFQGGVTEADLARALPRMVEETKRSVIDTVQRGGSVARVFR